MVVLVVKSASRGPRFGRRNRRDRRDEGNRHSTSPARCSLILQLTTGLEAVFGELWKHGRCISRHNEKADDCSSRADRQSYVAQTAATVPATIFSGLGRPLQAPRHRNGDRDEQTSTHTFMLVKGWDVLQAYQRTRSRSIRSRPAHLTSRRGQRRRRQSGPFWQRTPPCRMIRRGSKGESGN